MSTTRSQRKKNNHQESSESVSEGLVSTIIVENTCHLDQEVSVVGPSRSKSSRIENSLFENLKSSLKEEITSEIKSFLVKSEREILKLLKPKTGENVRANIEGETENEVRSFYTATRSFRINSPQNDPNESRNMVRGVLGDSNNQPKRPKIRSQSQPASKERPVVTITSDKNDGTTLPMPNALTASLITFDGNSDKFELFKDLFRNNIKMYPQLTEIQKNDYFHSLLR